VVNAPNDFELIEQLLVRQPVEAMERLARHFLPSALLRRRLAARDAKICSIAVGRAGAGREIARGIHRDLRRYNAAGYEYERDRPPADPRRAPGAGLEPRGCRRNTRSGALWQASAAFVFSASISAASAAPSSPGCPVKTFSSCAPFIAASRFLIR